MTTKRTPLARGLKAQITPAAIAAYRRMRAWDGRCTCPENAPYPGQVFVSSDPVCQERQRRYYSELDIYEAARAACPACPQIARAHETLLKELRLTLRPWQSGLENFPEVAAALKAATRERRTGRRGKTVAGAS